MGSHATGHPPVNCLSYKICSSPLSRPSVARAFGRTPKAGRPMRSGNIPSPSSRHPLKRTIVPIAPVTKDQRNDTRSDRIGHEFLSGALLLGIFCVAVNLCVAEEELSRLASLSSEDLTGSWPAAASLRRAFLVACVRPTRQRSAAAGSFLALGPSVG